MRAMRMREIDEVDGPLIGHGMSVHDAAYIAAARAMNGRLVSCDERDLVSKGLACLPAATPRAPGSV